jgi:hypothetical protein
MERLQIIKALNSWDTEKVVVFSETTGEYYEIVSIYRGMGKGIILEIEEVKQ